MDDMAPNVLIAAMCLACALPLITWSLVTRTTVTRRQMLENLQRQLTTNGEVQLDLSMVPSSSGALVSRKVTPRFLLRLLDRLHARAGRPARWPMERVVGIKVVLLLAGLVTGFLLWSGNPGLLRTTVALLAALFIWFTPEMVLAAAGERRRETISLKLPDAMDQLSIAVEAGLGFEGALRHVAHNTNGPLSDEITRTLQDLQVGVPRRDAYRALGDRVGVTDLRRFVRAIVQAEEQGISVAKVLQVQAGEMRVKRRYRAEEKAMRIPVMVVFPLFFCIFPALMIVVLGPAVINIFEAFTGGLVGVGAIP